MPHFLLHVHLLHRTVDLRLNAIRQASDVRRESSPAAQSQPAKCLYELRLGLAGDVDACGSLARGPTENEPEPVNRICVQPDPPAYQPA